jgi:phosphoribosylaminoimidazolecarboxamide formyltransferase/IMP cyclohydrolase
MEVRNALISVTNKTRVVELSRSLEHLGIRIFSTGGTAKVLAAEGVRVTEVATLTRLPEMLDGRVKTLDYHIFGGILAMRGKPEHMAKIAEHSIVPIDLVVVNLYNFKAAVSQDGPLEELIENIDIGGPSLLRAAAKNWQSVGAVVDPADYEALVAELEGNKGAAELSPETLYRLAAKVFRHTGEYDTFIGSTLSTRDHTGKPAFGRARMFT